MKKLQLPLLIIVLMLLHINLFAQYGGQRQYKRAQNRPQNDGVEHSRMNQKKMVLFVVYNSETVFKKIKLRDKSKIKKLGLVLESYNNKIIEIKAFESESLNVAKTYMMQKRRETKQSGDTSIMQEAHVRIKEILKPLNLKLKAQQNLLNLNFKNTLSPKQNEKWLKYQQSKLNPKPTESKNKSKMHNRDGR